ncbi:GNAT family N-acetyltransferase [Spartinivicinus poritis]|uniref:GNAT family N-acetyltransferase n=1 Tax=Spartinivicinus poritis TaxID=2994640 RepID=A0ABT5U6W3_9GAMM|nr:GNAT family N-acetyltransferase [Spartinivicinus sp. A2-2]MDE1461188.1 GNAT family N-acetyltransferase [Spartinivicinus sp. A2-2]
MAASESSSTIYYLEMKSLDQLNPVAAPALDVQLQRTGISCWQLNRFLYQAVGEPWQWHEKLSWSKQQWQAYVERDVLYTTLLYVSGTPAGYFELEQQSVDVELKYFGLLPQFIGMKLGGYLLSEAIRQAWQLASERVWVHTCTEDHPAALANYQARGFQLYNTETVIQS